MKKPTQNNNDGYFQAPLSEAKSKRLRDTFSKNPVDLLNSEQLSDLNNQMKTKASIKCNRVSKYLSSEGFRNNVEGSGVEVSKHEGKITNTNLKNIQNAHKMDEPKKFLKSFPHICENKRVYYD
jgi:hypothetical protein